MTEMARQVMDDSMDIHAGRAIQRAQNYTGYAYMGIPVAITVEGANILTRNLMIFGQGPPAATLTCLPSWKRPPIPTWSAVSRSLMPC